MNKLKNNNPDVKKYKTEKSNKLKKHIYVTIFSMLIALSTITTAFAAPEGVSTDKFNKIINIVFWVFEGVMALYGGVSLYKIVKGHNDEDPRTQNSGVTGLGIAAMCIGAAAAIKAIFF